jgi:hypothetical protein
MQFILEVLELCFQNPRILGLDQVIFLRGTPRDQHRDLLFPDIQMSLEFFVITLHIEIILPEDFNLSLHLRHGHCYFMEFVI